MNFKRSPINICCLFSPQDAKNLQRLYINDNSIDNTTAATHLANLLKGQRRLQLLDVQRNDFGPQGALSSELIGMDTGEEGRRGFSVQRRKEDAVR